MKKVLLATTMLVAGASIAAAEVTLSGDARMGIISNFGDDGVAANGDEGALTFTSRARVTFTLSGETDGGLSFGGSFRADNAGGAAGGTAGSVFISGAFGKLTMGDTDGAATAAVGHVDGVGLTGLGDFNESLFIANGGFDTDATFGTDAPGLTSDPTVRYEYSAGAFTGYVSATLPNYSFEVDADLAAADAAAGSPFGFAVGDFYEGKAYAIGGKYTIDAYTVSLGYETLEFGQIGAPASLEIDHLIVGADATFSGVTVKARYGKADLLVVGTAADLDQYALSATYAMDALSVTGFVNAVGVEAAGVGLVDNQAMGLGASYDLGGGAKVMGGVARIKDKVAGDSDTSYDLGVSFTF